MKQIHTHFGALLLLVILASSCTKEAPKTEFYEGENFYYFSVEEVNVLESLPDQIAVTVHYSSKDGGSGTASFSINDGSSTAVLDTDYSVVNSSSELTFNSDNDYSDIIYLQTIDNDEFTGGILDIVIDLENTQNGKAGFQGPANLRSSVKILIQDDDCPTGNIEGDYISTTTGTSTDACCPDPTTVEGEVSVIEVAEGEYQIFDWSVGLYLTWYEIFGISPEFVADGGLNAQITVLCDDVSAVFPEPFGTDTTLEGKVDLDNGTITYSWVNGFDDKATVTLTPK